MSFPYVSDFDAEDGTKGHFTTETDTESRLDFPHYGQLALIPGMSAPYRGAYCLRVNLANDGSPADALLQETTLWDMAADATLFWRFYFYLSRNTVMADTDEFKIWQLTSASGVEACFAINFTTASGFRCGPGETAATQLKPLSLGEWHCAELKINLDAGGGNDGTIDAWLDGATYTQITTLDQAVITSGEIGVIGQDAGTTIGTLLMDRVVCDDTRVGPLAYRWPYTVELTKTGHVFVGRGWVKDAQLLSGAGQDCALALYDTDIGSTTDPGNFLVELKNLTQLEVVNSSEGGRYFTRGCYAVLSGTDPRALVTIDKVPHYFSDGAIRALGHHRKGHPLGL